MSKRLRHLFTVALSIIIALVMVVGVSAPAHALGTRGCGTRTVPGNSTATVCVTVYHNGAGTATHALVTWSSGTAVSDVRLTALSIRTSNGYVLRSTSHSLPGSGGSWTWDFTNTPGNAHQMRATMYTDGHFGGDGYNSFGCNF